MKPIVIYEDKDYLGINKPAGLVVHPDSKTKEETLVNWLLENYPEINGVGESIKLSNGNEIQKPGIVHRLDRETSGVMLIAKNQNAYLMLKNQFKNREIEKTYNAFVYGNIKEEEGIIDRPIGKSKKDFRQWSAMRGARGQMREAITKFKVLARGVENAEYYTFVEAKPKTGRTHQIRVHFKATNHSIVCDKLYAPNKDSILGFERLALHAKSIIFKNLKGERIKVEAEYPEDFEKAINLATSH